MKHTVKILCMALSLIMLFAVNVPAMAEEETILDTRMTSSIKTETFDSETTGYKNLPDKTKTEVYTVEASEAITDVVYETGYRIRLSANQKDETTDYAYTQFSYSTSYPIINLRYAFSNDTSKVTKIYMTGTKTTVSEADLTYTLQDGEWNHEDWNTVKLVVAKTASKSTANSTDSTKIDIAAEFSVSMYLNGNLIRVFEYDYNPVGLSSDTTNPYRWRAYNYTDESTIDIDDIYIGKYEAVKDFTVAETIVKAVKYKGFSEPNPVNVLFGTDDPENPEAPQEFRATWEELSGTGYPTEMKGTLDELVYGSGDSIGSGYPVEATIEWLDLAYTTSINEGTLTITNVASDIWDAKIYGATYVGNKLTAVETLGEIHDCQWDENKTATVDMKSHTRAFILDSSLRPLASN